MTLGYDSFTEKFGVEYIVISFLGIVVGLLIVYKILYLHDTFFIIRYAFMRKKVLLDDVLFVRFGERYTKDANGTAHHIKFLAVHTKNDKEEDEFELGKRSAIYYLNFLKKDQEKIFKYYEDKGLLKERKFYKYNDQ